MSVFAALLSEPEINRTAKEHHIDSLGFLATAVREGRISFAVLRHQLASRLRSWRAQTCGLT
jgi:hypothetical protein